MGKQVVMQYMPTKKFSYISILTYRFPDDPNTLDIDRQFMLGPSILVSPVLEEVSIWIYFKHRFYISQCLLYVTNCHANLWAVYITLYTKYFRVFILEIIT